MASYGQCKYGGWKWGEGAEEKGPCSTGFGIAWPFASNLVRKYWQGSRYNKRDRVRPQVSGVEHWECVCYG